MSHRKLWSEIIKYLLKALEEERKIKREKGEFVCMKKNILILVHLYLRCFPGSLAGKESACSAGYPSSIPGSGKSHGEGILQYS